MPAKRRPTAPINNRSQNLPVKAEPTLKHDVQINKRGRPKGSVSKVNVMLREAFMLAADGLGDVTPKRNTDGSIVIGDDGKVEYINPPGEGGLVGFLISMGREQPRTFMQGLLRMLPHEMKMEMVNAPPPEQTFESEDEIVTFLLKRGNTEQVARTVARKMVEAARQLDGGKVIDHE